jgi:hypothetical protein
MQGGIMTAIAMIGQINEGRSDKETYKLVCKIVRAMEKRKRQEWPNKELRRVVNSFDPASRNLFLLTMKDMKEALEEAYKLVEEKQNENEDGQSS